MSKKDYIQFANMIRAMKGEIDEEARIKFAKGTAAIFRTGNNNFDAARFYTACEVDANA
jgi:hypothetical protein